MSLPARIGSLAPSAGQASLDAVSTPAAERCRRADALRLEALRLDVVYEDESLLIVNKPADVRMMGDFHVTAQKMVDAYAAAARVDAGEGEPASVAACSGSPSTGRTSYQYAHQLDYATSGVLVYSKRMDVSAATQTLFQERFTRKEYLAMCYGWLTHVPTHARGVSALPTLAQSGGTPLEAYARDEKDAAAAGAAAGTAAGTATSTAAEAATGCESGAAGAPQRPRNAADVRKGVRGVQQPRNACHFYQTLASQLKAAAPPPPEKRLVPTRRTIPPALVERIKHVSWGELKGLAREQRVEGEPGNVNIHALGAAWEATHACGAEAARVDPAAVFEELEWERIDHAHWAAAMFTACSQAAAVDVLRYRHVNANGGGDAAALHPSSQPAAAATDEVDPTALLTFAPVPPVMEPDTAPPLPAACVQHMPRFVIDVPVTEVSPADFRMRIARDTREGKACTTLVQVLGYGVYHGRPVTKLLLRPVSGRRHQLRLHCAHIGAPIVGDTTYCGDESASRMMLHAWRIALFFPHLRTMSVRSFRGRLKLQNAERAAAAAVAATASPTTMSLPMPDAACCAPVNGDTPVVGAKRSRLDDVVVAETRDPFVLGAPAMEELRDLQPALDAHTLVGSISLDASVRT